MMPAVLWHPCGGSILDKYEVRLLGRALQDLDDIYGYIARTLAEPGTATELIDTLESEILSLEYLPYRCPERRLRKRRLPPAHGKKRHRHLSRERSGKAGNHRNGTLRKKFVLRNLEGKYPLRLFLLRTTSYDLPPLCGFGDFLLSRVSAGKGNGGIFKGTDLILILD